MYVRVLDANAANMAAPMFIHVASWHDASGRYNASSDAGIRVMPRVLTIDLGVTTGFCVRDMNGDLLALGEVAYSDDLENAFLSLVQVYLPSHVVVEAPVIVNVRGELGGKLQNLISAAKRVFRTNTEFITPAQWKPRYGQTPLPEQDATPSAHMKDAYRIAEWWLKTR